MLGSVREFRIYLKSTEKLTAYCCLLNCAVFRAKEVLLRKEQAVELLLFYQPVSGYLTQVTMSLLGF